jgi:hypothetical protein
MFRFAAAVAFAFSLLATEARAVIIESLSDECDDEKVIRDAFDLPRVRASREKLNGFTAQLLRLKERDIVAIFGRDRTKPAKRFAMPVAQARGLLLSGFRSKAPKPKKDHTDLYLIGDYAAIEVRYYWSWELYQGTSGDTPYVILVYFPADDTFPKLTERNLDQRLASEQERFQKLLDYFEERKAEVFPWEVDPEEEKKLYEGEFTRDRKAKLELWKEAGKKHSWRMKIETFTGGGIRYAWFGADGKYIREAGPSRADALPDSFIWRHPDGIHEYRREEYHNVTGHLQWLRWERPDGGNIRFETFNAEDHAVSWGWSDKDGKSGRAELDENDDGIPDVFLTGNRDKGRHPLPLEKSWAVHPELIPPECRIPDQPDRCVPLRKVAAPPRKK